MRGATLQDQNVTRGLVWTPRYGSWSADLETDSAALLSGSVTITIAGLVMIGDIDPERSGVSASTGRYFIRGAIGWERHIKPRPYHSDGGVRLRTVLVDLCREALGTGFESKIALPADSVLGTAYQRIGTYAERGVYVKAREALSRLTPRWYVDAKGVSRFEERPSGVVTGEGRVSRRNLAQGLRIVGTDTPAAFVPGLDFEGKTIGAVALHVRPDDFRLEVWEAR